MTRARWLFAAALAGAAGCSSDGDRQAAPGSAGEADLVHYCDTLCRRDAECLEEVDQAACDASCGVAWASAQGKVRGEYVTLLDTCIAEMDCEALVQSGIDDCVDEVNALLPPTAAGIELCEALDARSDDCGEIYPKAICLQFSKQYGDRTLNDALACVPAACAAIDTCIRVAFGVTEAPGPDSCAVALNDVCDEPVLCPPGTDSYDCGR